jgi:hypothetical protein
VSSQPPQTLADVSWLAIILLAITGVVFVWLIVSGANYENKLSNLTQSSGFGTLITGKEVIDARDSYKTALLVAIAIQLVASLAFLPWFHRAYRNVERAGGRLRFTTGWAIGAWFVPILNLWRPKQIANDIWRSSQLDRGLASENWHSRPVSGLLHWWWVLYLGWSFLDGVGWSILSGNDQTLGTSAGNNTEQTGVGILIVAAVVGIVGVILATIFVRRVTQIQDAAVGAAGRGAGIAGVQDHEYPAIPAAARAQGAPPAPVMSGSPQVAAASNARYCSQCGAAQRVDDLYCSACGTPLRQG